MERTWLEESRDRLRSWHRGHPDRKIAGVCAALSRQLDWPLPLVRAGFLLAAVLPGFHAVGLTAYLVLWLLLPAEPGAPSLLDRVLDAVQDLFGAGPARDGDTPHREP